MRLSNYIGCFKKFQLLISLPLFLSVLPHQVQSADAAPPAQTESSKITLHHTSWKPKDGAPAYVTSLTQSTDGWLWVASSIGLYRFDGVRFELFVSPGDQLLYTDISSVKALADGSIWVGYRYGGASEIRDGRIAKHYPAEKGRLNGTTWDFARDPQGQVWVATSRGLFMLKEGEFHPAAQEPGAPPVPALQIVFEKNGALWLRSTNGIYSRAPGTASLKAIPGAWGWGGLLAHPDGSILANDHVAGGIRTIRGPDIGGPPLAWLPAPGPTGQLALDHAGRLWNVRPNGVEVLRSDAKPASQHLGLQQGLSGETGTAIFVDREGNIWVGTNGGLDRFRENKLAPYPAISTQAEALPLVLGKNGEIWTEKQVIDGPLSLPQLYDATPPSPTSIPVAEFVDPQGHLWTHSYDGLARVERTDRGFVRTVIPPPENLSGQAAAPGPGLGMDSDGGLWAIFGSNLYRLKDGKWTHNGGNEQLPKVGYTTMYTAPNGVLWVGTRKNVLFSLTGMKVRTFDEKDGINLGAITQLFWDGKTLWASGNNGLVFLDGTRFHKVVGHDQELFQATSGIAQSDDGDLWLNSGSGVFRIPLAERQRLLKEPEYRVRFRKFDHEDGLLGAAPQTGGARSIVSAKGKIWLSTTVGLFWFDPSHPLHNDLAPSVVIKGLAANDELYAANPGLVLPKGTDRIRIDYTALSLTMPERMQFRYRLGGVDASWQEVVNQRAAFYTGLAPGNYSFQVQASNNDGVWNDTGATLSFSIEPKITQTWWFKSLIAFLMIALIWMVHRLRLSRMAQRVREKLEERLDERERIARELHDTLLQSIQGMVLMVDNAAQRLSSQAEKDSIERALVLADAAIREGRDQVQGLRHEHAPGELFKTLHQFGTELAEGTACKFVPALIGEPRELHAIVGEEFRAITKEALSNAFRHAGAARIELQVHYGASELRVTVSDNGVGIPVEIQKDGGRARHWGMKGMRERASKIKATLVCQSCAEEGTRWQLSLPARLAYEDQSRTSLGRRFLNFVMAA
jgi:signal transduction histidine kinase/ligand-binding sensor domain-containing protein